MEYGFIRHLLWQSLIVPYLNENRCISGADHVRIYQPGEQSYLKAIQRFVELIQQQNTSQPPNNSGAAD